jgi:hypothetical protein
MLDNYCSNPLKINQFEVNRETKMIGICKQSGASRSIHFLSPPDSGDMEVVLAESPLHGS